MINFQSLSIQQFEKQMTLSMHNKSIDGEYLIDILPDRELDFRSNHVSCVIVAHSVGNVPTIRVLY